MSVLAFYMRRRELLMGLFQACNNGKSVTQLHSQIIKTGHIHDTFLATKLNSLYAKYTPPQTARKLFDETPQRTVYIWNFMLGSYCREKQYEETLLLFSCMVSTKKPDNFTIPIALKACASLRLLQFGQMIHGFVEKNVKIGLNMFVGSALIEFYSKSGLMGYSLRVFEEYSQPDIVLWTTMVGGYEKNGDPEGSLAFFSRMVMVECVTPDTVTLVCVVSACAQLLDLKGGRMVHGFVIRRGLDTALSLLNTMLNLYAKTGSVNVAAKLFRKMEAKDVISWSSMIDCYAQNGNTTEALDIFNEMIAKRFEPNPITIINALQACELACNLEEGKKIHDLAAQKGFEMDISVSTALIEMYMKCSSPNEAINLFERIPEKDSVSWVALLSGYIHNGMACKAMGVFRQILSNEIQPDSIAMVKILTACAELGILQQAFCLHGYIIRGGFNNNAFVGASLIELYSKCGSLDNAVKVFEGINNRDVVIWSSMVAGYGIHGRGVEALRLFNQIVNNSAVRPNNVTFLSVLSACSHSGLVREGIDLFDMMVHEYQLMPDSKHYGIMVDLLGRTGELDNAMRIIDRMPVPAGPHVWGALLGACRIHQNIEMGEVAARNLFQLDPNHAGYRILLSNIYAVDGQWDNAAKLRTLMKGNRLKKIFGQSVVEIKSEVHSFVAGDRSHPDSEQIHGFLRKLEVKMREEAYVPDVDFLLHGTEGIELF